MKKIIILLATVFTLNNVQAQEKTTVAVNSTTSQAITKTTIKKKKKISRVASSKTVNNKPLVNTAKDINSTVTETITPKQHPNPLPIAPMYAEGQQAMFDFIKNNIKVPIEVSKNNMVLTMTVTFKVAIDGTLKEIKAVKTDAYGCDSEAERIVKAMPKWIAGRVGRKFVEMPTAIDIEFK